MRYLGLAVLVAFALSVAPAAVAADAMPGHTTDPGILDGSKQRRLDLARKTWKLAGLRSYRYVLTHTCFCPRASDVTIVVRKGHPAAGTPKALAEQATVPRLFRTIQRAIDAKASGIKVKYGARGVPASISIDPEQQIADEESFYTIKRFTRLKSHAR